MSELYAPIADIDDYHTLRGNALWTGAAGVKTAAAWRAQTWLDAQPFRGYRTERDQDNAWPRKGVVDVDGYLIPDDEVPQKIVNALCEAALIELTDAGSLTPEFTPGVTAFRLEGILSESYSSATGATIHNKISQHLRGLVYSGHTLRIELA